MTKKDKHASTLIENDAGHDISDSQKKHFSKLGYKPYMSYRGKIKWLNYEQQLYERIKYAKKNPLTRTRKYRPHKRRRVRRRSPMLRLFTDNWILIVIVIGILFFLLNYGAIVNFVTKLMF